ncbi:MAG: VOC family protein [Desulfarculaceae bacterium]|nr:VOC family protein [Desulfarculaceae bacterium]MCF8073723.1 VOC family protein [Desulfarculaceae bacterium]MCF8101964.1 VOC family protein [Desulfarculaceae bacterium]MCF8115934.1 VOC family protein [Desulfarculaceae bacterium]
MLQKIDHIGIAVHELEPALELYQKVYGLEPVKIETLEDIHVRIAFLPLGEVLMELLQPTAPGAGRIGQFLDEKGPGFHHIAYRVENIEQAMAACEAAGVGIRDSEPRPGGDDSRIVFLVPADTHNVLTELVERSREITGD